MKQVLNPWMRYFLAFDPRPALEKIRVPVLALNGELDVQVDAKQNLTAIATALDKGGNRNVNVHGLPKHNHLFQRAKTGLVNEYAVIEETISPEGIGSDSRLGAVGDAMKRKEDNVNSKIYGADVWNIKYSMLFL